MKFLKTDKTSFQFAIVFFVIFLYDLLIRIPLPEQMHAYCTNFYFSAYDAGFISRGFIGTLLKFLFPFLSTKTLYLVIAASVLVLIGTVVYFLIRCIKSSHPTYQAALIFLCFAFCVNPGSIAYLFYYGNYGRFDMYHIIILVVCCLCIAKKHYVPVFLLSVCGILIHQIFLFLFFPAIALMYLYSISIEDGKRAYVGFFLTLGTVFLLALHLQFFGNPSDISWEELLTAAQSRTDWTLHPDPFRKEYAYTLSDHLSEMTADVLVQKLKKSVGVFLSLLPLLWIFVSVWRRTICRAENKWIYFLFVLSPLGALPAFMMADWGRWFAAMIISQFILIFFLVLCQDINMSKSLCALTSSMKSDWPLYVFCLLLLAVPGKFEAANILGVPIDQMAILWNLIMP